MKNCTGIRCVMQDGKVDPATCKAAWHCEYATPPVTNADRIRGMSDEELAEWIETIADCWMCKIDEKHCSGGELNTRESCMIHWLYWLRQEAPHDQP